MSIDPVTRLEQLYDAMQRRFPVTPGVPELAEATQFLPNRSRAVHRWFHFKEGFSADLLAATGIDMLPLAREDAVFLDPFCGSGTTLLAGDLELAWHARRVGLDVNPFLCFVAQTKTNWRSYDPVRLNRLVREILDQPLREDLCQEEWPGLSTLHNAEMFSPTRVSGLLDAISRVRAVQQPERDVLMLGVAAAAEKLGFYRKDGRALRVLRTPTELAARKSLNVSTVLRDLWQMYEADLRALASRRNEQRGQCTVVCGDGRTIVLPESDQVSFGEVSLMAYSPPYLNHIDYTEVYKVELWLLGFVASRLQMLELRKRTLRSHASIAFKACGTLLPRDVRAVVETASQVVQSTGKRWHRRFRDTAFGYLEDMQQSLAHQYHLLRSGGRAICVVGNSAHGSKHHRIPIATDLLISSVARSVGLQVQQLYVARHLRRRDSLNRYLRETVIVLRRPARD